MSPSPSLETALGPPPVGQESNWIPTVAEKGWFPFFRFYGPKEPLFEKNLEAAGHRIGEVTQSETITVNEIAPLWQNTSLADTFI